MYGLVIKAFQPLLLDDGLALGGVLLDVYERPGLLAGGEMAHAVVVLPEPMVGISGDALVEDVEALTPDDVGVEHNG